MYDKLCQILFKQLGLSLLPPSSKSRFGALLNIDLKSGSGQLDDKRQSLVLDWTDVKALCTVRTKVPRGSP